MTRTASARRPPPTSPTSPASRGLGADLVAVGCAGLLVVVAAAIGVWLLDRGVPLHVDVPPLGAQWLPHTGPATVPAILVGLLVVLRGPELATRLPWHPLLGVSAATAVAWTTSLALIDGWQRGIVGRLMTPTEYLHDVPRVGDVGAMLRGFAERIPAGRADSWTTQVAGHPPGALLVFVGLDRTARRGASGTAVHPGRLHRRGRGSGHAACAGCRGRRPRRAALRGAVSGHDLDRGVR
ncbi:MAG: hypothetical protein ACRDR6_12095 [Pseudonocardiaceae bacterium]